MVRKVNSKDDVFRDEKNGRQTEREQKQGKYGRRIKCTRYQGSLAAPSNQSISHNFMCSIFNLLFIFVCRFHVDAWIKVNYVQFLHLYNSTRTHARNIRFKREIS